MRNGKQIRNDRKRKAMGMCKVVEGDEQEEEKNSNVDI